ncbi:hypothetical protein ACA910_020861 [Epithemia clementina (nom. ined.)]
MPPPDTTANTHHCRSNPHHHHQQESQTCPICCEALATTTAPKDDDDHDHIANDNPNHHYATDDNHAVAPDVAMAAEAAAPIGVCVPCGHAMHVSCAKQWYRHIRRQEKQLQQQQLQQEQPQKLEKKCPLCNSLLSGFIQIYVDLTVPPRQPPSIYTTQTTTALTTPQKKEFDQHRNDEPFLPSAHQRLSMWLLPRRQQQQPQQQRQRQEGEEHERATVFPSWTTAALGTFREWVHDKCWWWWWPNSPPYETFLEQSGQETTFFSPVVPTASRAWSRSSSRTDIGADVSSPRSIGSSTSSSLSTRSSSSSHCCRHCREQLSGNSGVRGTDHGVGKNQGWLVALLLLLLSFCCFVLILANYWMWTCPTSFAETTTTKQHAVSCKPNPTSGWGSSWRSAMMEPSGSHMTRLPIQPLNVLKSNSSSSNAKRAQPQRLSGQSHSLGCPECPHSLFFFGW